MNLKFINLHDNHCDVKKLDKMNKLTLASLA